ncbi:outer membrane beta-barrel protein [Pleionea litopenaei]|uniref:Outer membrane beta-barrel protein n=1 Tax=Pleionea litopenaei TaxID=3070815 RepID=A0AA51RRV0_9GAMM|nr:outer membrane beta-barrel protein [Pleionea sp. HL-JVS1]WMS86508.1 outer membrane beta-barrel protein [Pleionea sp. HL-JVS1]
MKKTLIAIFFTIGAIGNLCAYQSHNYVEVHLGQTDVALVQAPLDYSHMTIGGVFGYQMDENFGAEFLVTFATEGDAAPLASQEFATVADVKVNAYGGYFVARTSGDFYIEGKLGLAATQFAYTAGGYEDLTETNFGLSYGVGVGYQAAEFYIEANLLSLPEVDDPYYIQTSYESESILLTVGFDF